ncbi:complement C1q and tumor necrosis factor-related protein 9-like [Heptranchias perlo]|uniref:complement C1q and tumor necrosis factor-related protein 9-like n=1 Tax=Heptranchias perlo TaxID=212740 RepID=UPI0035597FFB
MLNAIAVLALLTIAEGTSQNDTMEPSIRGMPDPLVEYNMCPLPDQEYPFSTDMVPSYCVCMHCRGPKGEIGRKGDRGNSGPPGRPGLSGMKGAMGSSGRRGPRGYRGIKGQKGARGPRGMMGLKGNQGRRGFRGLRGRRGNTGANGRPGLKGSMGFPGQCPADCNTKNGNKGQKGDTGFRGPKGDMGEPGMVGQPGSKGEPGSNGLKGEQGVKGPKGGKGEQGICDCVDGAKGERGNVGPEGPQGAKGDVGPMAKQGEQGVKGDKGKQGNEGEVGPPGPCVPTIQSAFSAGRSAEDGLPSPYVPIPFNVVFYNIQGHFKPAVGVYIAPTNGTYMFSYHLSILESPVKMGLFRNRQLIIRTANKVTQDQASQTVILHLDAGDKIWLQVKDSNFNGMYADQDTDSTFSGFLLYPDSCHPVTSRTKFPSFGEGSSDYYSPDFGSESPTPPVDDGSGSGSGSGSSSGFGSFEPNFPYASETP